MPLERILNLYQLMVEGMSVIVNVMLSLMSLMSPSPTLRNLSVHTIVWFMYYRCFCFRDELEFLDCDLQTIPHTCGGLSQQF